MVELNFDRRRPAALLDLTRVAELAEWDERGRPGPARRRRDLRPDHRASSAAGCPGSPWPRAPSAPRRSATAAPSGGNLGAASPAGDAHPAAARRRRRGRGGLRARRAPRSRSPTSTPASSATPWRPDELIRAVLVPPATGPQQFSKIGTRNAMVIAVAAFGLALHPRRGASAPASAPLRRPRGRARRRRGVPGRRARRGWPLGVSGRAAGLGRGRVRQAGDASRPPRSTTSAAPRRTGSTPSR